ncbi:unnamed protein product [Coffea canephora]|uniref:Uncharacterized protein n=1 Tax=Coffea canephora TaxID=49390 RepID=A0A068V630_COFCA|nr:unnamed protein product [Coffea canephora]
MVISYCGWQQSRSNDSSFTVFAGEIPNAIPMRVQRLALYHLKLEFPPPPFSEEPWCRSWAVDAA